MTSPLHESEADRGESRDACQYCQRESVNDDRECEQCAEDTAAGRDYDKRKLAYERSRS